MLYERHHHRIPDDFQIPQEGDVVHIFHVHFEFLLPADGVSAMYLGVAGQAGADLVAAVLLGVIPGQVLHQQGPGADDAHVALDDVERLGQLVQGGLPQDAAIPIEPYLVRQQLAVLVLPVVHGAEFDELKNLFALARPLLGKEGVAAHEDGSQDHQDYVKPAKHDHCSQPTQNIQGPLEEPLIGAIGFVIHAIPHLIFFAGHPT